MKTPLLCGIGYPPLALLVLSGISAGPALAQPVVPAAPVTSVANGGNGGNDECTTCHLGLDDPLATPAQLFGDDIHAARGFGCADCHGGDPSASRQEVAMDPRVGYRGTPSGWDIVDVCARCHSDPTLMRRFSPGQRVDQATEYAVSVHGQRLAEGDVKVATCSSCHGAHGIRQVSDAKSAVFPLNVADTCGRCHDDPVHMTGYELRGAPFPTGQRAAYSTSVHSQALTEGNNLSAATCNDCHGNHGAAPPGVDAVTNVCGTCHRAFAERYEPTIHAFIFERGCAECHGNHDVDLATDDLLGADPSALCTDCHREGDAGLAAASAMRTSIDELNATLDQTRRLVERARNAGMEMGDQELALNEARNYLTLARTEMHTFDPPTVTGVVYEGLALLAGVDEAGQDALAELRFRRIGLAVSLVLILLFVVALGLKVRQLDRRLPMRR